MERRRRWNARTSTSAVRFARTRFARVATVCLSFLALFAGVTTMARAFACAARSPGATVGLARTRSASLSTKSFAGARSLHGFQPLAAIDAQTTHRAMKDAQLNDILAEIDDEAVRAAEKEAQEPQEEDPWAGIKDAFSWVLVVDVFTAIFLAVWLIVGVVAKFVLQQPFLLETFLTYWDPYFQGILGIFFAARLFGTIFASILEQGVSEEEQEEDRIKARRYK